jgi:hypothetical protein
LAAILKEGGAGGAGELVAGTGTALVPLTLAPRVGSRDSSGIFVTEGTLRPSVRALVKRRADGTYQLNLKVNRATIAAGPALCAGDPSTTTLNTTISFGDGTNPPVLTKSFHTTWICASGRLRVAPPGPAPTPVPGTPIAKVVVNQLSRETGEPNLVALDGSGSSDSDGTIASYTFSVANVDNRCRRVRTGYGRRRLRRDDATPGRLPGEPHGHGQRRQAREREPGLHAALIALRTTLAASRS